MASSKSAGLGAGAVTRAMQFQQQGQRTAGSRTKKTTDGGGRPDLTGDTPHLGWGAVPNQTWTGSGSTKNPPRWVTAGDWSPITARWLQWLPPSGSPRMAVAPSRRQGSTLQNKSDPQFSSGYSNNFTTQAGVQRYVPVPREGWKDAATDTRHPDRPTSQPDSSVSTGAASGAGVWWSKGRGRPPSPTPPSPLFHSCFV